PSPSRYAVQDADPPLKRGTQMPLDPNRWTLKTQEALAEATRLATEAHHPEVLPAHMLLAAISQDGGVAIPILDRVGAPPASVRNRLNDVLAKIPQAYGGATPDLSRPLLEALNRAEGVERE